jgi:thymidylate kinase
MTQRSEPRKLEESRRTLTLSFSGVDGAGKSTQIEQLLSSLSASGYSVRVFRFWDHVARLTRIREGTGHTVFKGDKGIGSPEAPINRRDKNVRGWPMTCLRLFLYLVDAISLRSMFRRATTGELDCVIFDRYIYDELANLDLESTLMTIYVRWIMWLVPRPDVSFILDADPLAARARKPEYPLEFIRINREAYLRLSRMLGGFTIVAPTNIEAAKRAVTRRVQSAFLELKLQQRREYPDTSGEETRTGTAVSRFI